MITQIETLQTAYDERVASDEKFREHDIGYNFLLMDELAKTENMCRFLQDQLSGHTEAPGNVPAWFLLNKINESWDELKEDFDEVKGVGKYCLLLQNIQENLTVLKNLKTDLTLIQGVKITTENNRLHILEVTGNLHKLNQHYKSSYG